MARSCKFVEREASARRPAQDARDPAARKREESAIDAVSISEV
jgi:hypothetical protein